MGNLTDQAYWENYYSRAKPQKSQIESVVSEYNKYWDFLISRNNTNPPKSLIEIGGHPGRYLAYLAHRYDLEPTSLDFNSDRSKIEDSMSVFGIKNYHIMQSDIFEHEIIEKYDVVISNGFIEHFKNFDEVLDKHCDYLKPGGTMLVMIPNMRNYIKFYKILVDRKNLKIHNLKSMKRKVFVDFGARNNLKLLKLEYFGGFPFSVHQELNIFQKIIFKTHRILFKFFLNKYLADCPNQYFSSTIIAIYKK